TSADATSTATSTSAVASTSANDLVSAKAVVLSAENDSGLVEVTKGNFLDYFTLNGSATYDSTTGIVTLTTASGNEVGNFTLDSKINMNQSFTLTGYVNLGSNVYGADGISFAFHSGNTDDLGVFGGNLGIGGLENVVGFKLDTWHNGYKSPSSTGDETNQYGWEADPTTSTGKYGAFVNTTEKIITGDDGNSYTRWWGTVDTNSVQALSNDNLNGEMHKFVISYDGTSKQLTISYTETDGTILTWSETVSTASEAMAMVVSASTGGANNLQQFQIESFDYYEAATVNVKYVDEAGNELTTGSVSYPDGSYQGKTYETTPKSITGYTLEKVVGTDSTNYTDSGTLTNGLTGTLSSWGNNGTVIYVYVLNTEKAKVTYIDDTTDKTLSTKNLSGDYGTTDSYRTTDTIKDYENQGYSLVSDDYPSTGVVYDEDGTVKSYEVHLTHKTSESTESKEVNETIHYVYSDGSQAAADYTATPVKFTRTVTTDSVTGDKTYGDWTAEDGTSFTTVTSPTILGYTADQLEVGEITGITADTADIEKTVVYTANTEKAKVTYIDDTTDKTLSTKNLSGDYGTTDSYRTTDTIKDYENQGYSLVSDDYPSTGVVYDEDGTVKSYEVHLTHKTSESTESKEVNETIHYVYSDGSQAAADYTATPVKFTRTVTTDSVTGNKTYGDWTAENGTSFAAVTSPTISGYTADQLEVGEITGITADTADVEKTVVYTKDVTPTTPTSDSSTNTPTTPTSDSSTTNNNNEVTQLDSATTASKPSESSASTKATLPQTGDAQNNRETVLGVILVALASIGGLFGIGKKRKKGIK
ncbi:MucBP domain-containing protein, partial [Ligilactobacillus sp. WILCCON 0076]